MQAFQYLKVKTEAEAILHSMKDHRVIAGGTTLIDLMKLEVETPKALIDVNHLPWNTVALHADELKIGALVKNSDLANHPDVKKRYAALSQAILAGASAQLRNKATTGGNLLQRTRCVYFRDPSKDCNKREPGSGCSAIEGFNRNLAILGTSESCIASNPSDMNVAMAAFEARVHLSDGKHEREVSIADFHLLPGKTPHLESILKEKELITAVTLPKLAEGTQSLYLKLRDRASYEFALASVAVVAKMNGHQIERIRFAMGGIATKPWRVPSAELLLEGQSNPTDEKLQAVATEFLKGAKGYADNGFKIELARRCLVRGLKLAIARGQA